jgi:Na+/H+ antiporter NhaC
MPWGTYGALSASWLGVRETIGYTLICATCLGLALGVTLGDGA